MIFQKTENIEQIDENNFEDPIDQEMVKDDVETIVGPSVNVEGDLSSNGNIIVKGSVMGSVNTSKLLTVEQGAKIVANIKAGSAQVSGDIKGNIKVSESLELTSSSRVLGDITVKSLSVEPGAIIYGKISMPGISKDERKKIRIGKKGRKSE